MTEEKDVLTTAGSEGPGVSDSVTDAWKAVAEAQAATADAIANAEAALKGMASGAETAAETAGETVTEDIEAAADAVMENATETVAETVSEVTDTTDAISAEAEEEALAWAAATEELDKAAEAALDTKEDTSKAGGDSFAELLAIAEKASGASTEELRRAQESAGLIKEPEQLSLDLPEEPQKEAYDIDAARENYEAEQPVIVFDHVHKEYEGQVEDSVALVDVSFSIKKGEFVFIVGPSGSGKSTMIRLMMREISPSGGKIYIAGKNLAKLRRRHVSKYRRNIGIVFQDFRLLPDRNVFDNVAFAQRVVGARKRDIPKEVSKVLHLVGLSQKYKSFPNELSGGEQQRVAIARALVNNPMIILADEPTGNLDPQNSLEIMSLLEEINRRGTTVVIVTHDQAVVDQMQKRVVVLQEGTIVEDNKKGGYGLG